MILLQTAKPILLDFLSSLFFVLLFAATHSLPVSIGVAIGVGVVQILIARLRGQRIEPMQWLSLALVLTMGGASLLTRDPRFLMVKPTLIYAAVGAGMMQRGWQVRYLPPKAAPWVDPKVLIGWGYAWAGLMFATAAANLAIALTAPFAVWAWCVATLYGGLKLALFAVEYIAVRHHARRRYRLQPAAA